MEHRTTQSRYLVVGAALLAVLIVSTTSVAMAASSPAKSHGAVTLTEATKRSSSIPPPRYSKKCEREARTTLGLAVCVAAEVAQLDGELSRALSVEATLLGHSGVASTEFKWLAFVKSECALEARPYSGGDYQPLTYDLCERGLLVSRITGIRSAVNYDQIALPHEAHPRRNPA
jgi:uncharacterized protein YecT (DUF1311 family)